MVKSSMDFFDVLFPLSIGPLTYRRPSNLARIERGMLVRAEVKKSVRSGIVLGRAERPPVDTPKEILEIVLDGPVLSGSMVSLLKWMAGYYLAPEGIVLKGMFPPEYFGKREKKKQRKKEKGSVHSTDGVLPAVSAETLSRILSFLSRGKYGTCLFHAFTTSHETSYALNVVKEARNVIILAPEMTHIDFVAPFLRETFGERLTILHGKLSKGARVRAFDRILSGDSDIVLGTRLAVFAPLKSASLIWVIQEHSRSYKSMEGVRYHARDVAVMRGFLETSAVVLSSAAPSLESFYNTVKGKYTLIESDEPVHRPKVEVVNMKTAKKVTPYFSRRAFQAASACIRDGEGVLFFINRKGYSMIQCAECNTIETCPQCRIPLIYHKDRMILRCHYCGHAEQVPDKCRKCRGTRLEMVGAGTQRIAADMKKYLNIEPLRLDNDAIREHPDLKRFVGIIGGGESIVGTRAVTGRLRKREAFRLCVLLNPDIGLHVPDFRSPELFFQEILSLSEHVKPEGLIIIQTRMPDDDVFRHIRSYRYYDFVRAELSKRRSLAYPPFSNIITITVASGAERSGPIAESLSPGDEKIETIGPLEWRDVGCGGKKSGPPKYCYKVLLKSPERERLRGYAKNILENLRREKGLRIAVDVDPISL